MVPDAQAASVFRNTNRSGFSRSRGLARQGEGEEKTEHRQCGYDQHRDREPRSIGEEAEHGGADPAEADREPHSDAGSEPYAPGEVLLAHDHGDAEGPDGGRADEREQEHSWEGTREREAVDQEGQ